MSWTPSEEAKYLIEWLRHEDMLFANRASMVLLAESVLMAGFAAVALSDAHAAVWMRFSMAGCGVVIAILWWMLAWRHIKHTHKPIKARLAASTDTTANPPGPPVDPIYTAIASAREGKAGWIGNHDVFGYLIPLLTILVWAILVLSPWLP